MQYLANQNIVHGDLAARNVLLCKNNIVKIGDFGLAKSLGNNPNYPRQLGVSEKHTMSAIDLPLIIKLIYLKLQFCLPLRWMAIESIKHNTFSVKSDVWSFGVFMWEIFSIGAFVVPYENIRPEHLQKQLEEGIRLDCPKYATPEM